MHLHSQWHYQFSNQCNIFHKGIFKIVIYEREQLGLSKDQGTRRNHNRRFGYWFNNHATSTTKGHFIDSTKWLQKWLSPNSLFMIKYFWMDLIVTLIHCVTHEDVSHFSKSQHTRTCRANCNKSLTDILVKRVPVQNLSDCRSDCSIIQRIKVIEVYTHPRHIQLYLLFYHLIHSKGDLNKFTFQYSCFHLENGDLSMTPSRMKSHCMTYCCGVHSLLGLF